LKCRGNDVLNIVLFGFINWNVRISAVVYSAVLTLIDERVFVLIFGSIDYVMWRVCSVESMYREYGAH